MAYKFEIYRDKANEFRVRFRAPNGEKMFSTEGYAAKASARNVIKSIIKNTPKALVEDLSDLRAKSATPKTNKTKKGGKTKTKKTKKTKSRKVKNKKA